MVATTTWSTILLPFSVTVNTPDFDSGSPGSNPGGVANFKMLSEGKILNCLISSYKVSAILTGATNLRKFDIIRE